MARENAPVFGLDVDLLSLDSFLFADPRDGHADPAAANAPISVIPEEVAEIAPVDFEAVEAPPVEAPDIPAPAGPSAPVTPDSDLILMSGVRMIEPMAAAKGGNGGGGGGKPDNGGGGGGGGEPGLLDKYVSGSGDGSGYNVEVVFSGAFTVALQEDFVAAADYLSTIITGDVADVFFRGKVIDDIRIDASIVDIDGAGGILGQAGPTAYRTADYLPATAIMEFDVADAEVYDAAGLFYDIVLHEMTHSIGFGTMWDLMGLLQGTIADDTLVFTGAGATEEYADLFKGTGYVPVETDGGPGTAGGHWDEATFDNELMTGYIDPMNFYSDMTVAALEDMGYETVWESSLVA